MGSATVHDGAARLTSFRLTVLTELDALQDLVATTVATAPRKMLHDNHAEATHALVDGPLGAMVTSLRTRREPMDV